MCYGFFWCIKLIWCIGIVICNINMSNIFGFRGYFIMMGIFYSIKLVIRILCDM